MKPETEFMILISVIAILAAMTLGFVVSHFAKL
jgi:Tfp pilus assembly major pilin PilA